MQGKIAVEVGYSRSFWVRCEQHSKDIWRWRTIITKSVQSIGSKYLALGGLRVNAMIYKNTVKLVQLVPKIQKCSLTLVASG